MKLLKKYGILFGASICYTRDNVETVTSDEFLNMLADNGVRYSFYFHYMLVGNNAVPELMPTVEQRKYMIKRLEKFVRINQILDYFQLIFKMMVSLLVDV